MLSGHLTGGSSPRLNKPNAVRGMGRGEYFYSITAVIGMTHSLCNTFILRVVTLSVTVRDDMKTHQQKILRVFLSITEIR